jgi:hypothetical protein
VDEVDRVVLDAAASASLVERVRALTTDGGEASRSSDPVR